MRTKLFSDFAREEPMEGAGVKLPGGAQKHVDWRDSAADDIYTVATDVRPAPAPAPALAPSPMPPVAEAAEDVIEIGANGFDISGDDDTADSTAAAATPPPPPPVSSATATLPPAAPAAAPPPSRNFAVVQPVRLSAREQGNAAFAAERFEEVCWAERAPP